MPLQSTPYHFTATQDWFSAHEAAWMAYFALIQSPTPRVLEIGSWEGRSAVFTLLELCGAPGPKMDSAAENDHDEHDGEFGVKTRPDDEMDKGPGSIVCIDHFDLFRTPAGRERYRKLLHNLSTTGGNYTIIPQFSVPGLISLISAELSSANGPKGFDFVYVDASHRSDDTLLDAELAWRLLKNGGIMTFDDYRWDVQPADSIEHPKRGIDCFLKLHEGEWERLSDEGSYQLVIRKTGEMRVGFLMGEAGMSDDGTKGSCDDAFGYGVHIALTIDSAYAMPAAVAICSLVSNTRSKVTFHIVDCGLLDSDKTKLHESIPSEARPRTTIHFIDLPRDSFGARLGSTWAKIDLLDLLPVERCLYLDADVLVRADIQELWDVDLGESEIGAIADVGFPIGHAGIELAPDYPYFNAGLLLLDLTKSRARTTQLHERADACITTKARFRDQDALNLHFAGSWKPLDMRWNAQGLGTYANQYAPERHALPGIEAMKADAWIVHFTGPVHPRMASVLNPYVQPWLSKPWGYAGAPGHPYAGEWWGVLEETAWKGLASSAGWKEECEGARMRAIEEGVREFKERVGA